MMSIISCLLFSTVSIMSARVKHCVNCKHFLGAIDGPNTQDVVDSYNVLFGKCALFPVNDPRKMTNYLISGKEKPTEPIIDYRFCSTARSFEDMCGIDGQLYKKYVPVKIPNQPPMHP